MFDNLRADIRLARDANVEPAWWGQNVKVLFQLGTLAVVSYRLCHWVYTLRLPIVRHLLLIPAVIFRSCVQLLTGVNISPRAEIGPGLVVHTVYGIFIPAVKIGANFVVQTGVLIGGGTRGIGDNVYFGAGAKAVENVMIGNNVIVAPNSLVLADVPDNVTVIGVPARIQLQRSQRLWFECRRAQKGGDRRRKERQAQETLTEREPWTLRGLMNKLLFGGRLSSSLNKN